MVNLSHFPPSFWTVFHLLPHGGGGGGGGGVNQCPGYPSLSYLEEIQLFIVQLKKKKKYDKNWCYNVWNMNLHALQIPESKFCMCSSEAFQSKYAVKCIY